MDGDSTPRSRGGLTVAPFGAAGGSSDVSVEACDTADATEFIAIEQTIDAMVAETGGALAAVGLTHSQFVLLLAVSEFECVTTDILARILVVGSTRIQSELEPLLEKGILCPVDDDPAVLTTTAHGRGLLQRAIPLWEAAQSRIRSVMRAQGDEWQAVSSKKPTAALG
jgi:hypothetical protein